MPRFVALLLAAAPFIAGQSPGSSTRNSSLTDWRDDLDAIVHDIRSLHPAPFARVGELTFIREVEALKAALPRLTEPQRVAGAMKLIALLGDGHTSIAPDREDFASWYPIRVQEFSDGYFVTTAHASAAELAGAQLLQVAGRNVAEVMERARDLIGCDNSSCRKERVYAFHNAALMRGLGYADSNGNLAVRVKLRDGQIADRVLASHTPDDPSYRGQESSFEWQYRGEMLGMPFGRGAWRSAYQGLPGAAFLTEDPARPLHLSLRSRYYARSLPEQKAFYIQLNQTDDTSFVTFMHDALLAVDQAKPRHLIVDLRYNFGGDASRVSEVIHEFIKREGSRTWQLYILTGGKTFSAALGLLHGFVEHIPLTIVGEPPGAPFNFFGDATSRKYRATGLELHVSVLRHQFSDSADVSEFVPVDVPAPFSFADYVAGRDPAVDPILRGEEMRSIATIIRADGGAAARKVWRERKEKFAVYPWWTPPREFDLRAACRDLEHHRRMEDALEACTLTTEIQPFIWNSWYNLGNVQRQTGRMQEAAQSYRKVFEFDPNNFNGARLRTFINIYGGGKP